MKKDRKKKRGNSLPELVGVLAVLVLLMGIGASSIAKNMEKTNMTVAVSALKGYEDAFHFAVSDHPGIMKDREVAWGTAGEKYTTKAAMSRVVKGINKRLDIELQLEWNEELQHYASHAEDPWGGRYVLTEFPSMPDSTDLFDPRGAGKAAMRLAIWSTGKQELGEEIDPITDKYVGVGLEYVRGEINVTYHGTEDAFPFTGGTIKNK